MIHTDGTPTIAHREPLTTYHPDDRIVPYDWVPPVGDWLAGEVRAALAEDNDSWDAEHDAFLALAEHCGLT